MNIYELKAAYQDLQSRIEDGDEDLEEALEQINDQLEAKADGYARVIKNMEAQAEMFKAEEKRLAENRKRIEEGVERLKKNLFTAMKETGKLRFNTDLFSFKITKNGGKAPIVLDVPEEDLPDDLVKVTVTRKADKDAIAKYIEETGDETYAHVGERGERLSIK